MAILISPGLLVQERDLTGIAPGVATTPGASVGAFQWGPVDEIVTLNNEAELVLRFGKPDTATFKSFFTAANFLQYGNVLHVVRVVQDDTALNATISGGTPALIKNRDDFENDISLTEAFYGKYPGTLGNSIKLYHVDSTNWDDLSAAELAIFPYEPTGTDIHFAVVDADGAWTGEAGTVMERHYFLSKTAGAKKEDGSIAYYKDALNRNSSFVWSTGSLVDVTIVGVLNISTTLTGGVNGNAPADSELQTGFDLFADAEAVDVSLIPTGAVSATVATYVMQNICETRMDCMAFISPEQDAVVNNKGSELSAVKTFADSIPSSSYGVLDSGWKYMYDKYNDVYRWVPLNGDIAGLCARTDFIADPWFSPGGYNRGVIKGVVKLAWNPNQAARDTLYPARVNPVVTFAGIGTVLYGDKTLLARPSAFDRINVRRLFIVLEKTIATAAKFQLFEINDEVTRAQFRNLVNPFLREVQGRRGVTDFRVVCDTTNNTPQVIDSNEFRGDIYIKPSRSINFIYLTFTAVRTGVEFEEVVTNTQTLNI